MAKRLETKILIKKTPQATKTEEENKLASKVYNNIQE